MSLKVTLPLIGILLALLFGAGLLLRAEIKKNGELENSLDTALATSAVITAERNALDLALVSRDRALTAARATADKRLQQLKRVQADACLDASVPVAIDSLLNAGAGGAGH